MFTTIVKRDGRSQAFHESKITDAIFKCFQASEKLTDKPRWSLRFR